MSSGEPIPFFESLFAQVAASVPHLQQLSIHSIWAPCSFIPFTSCCDLRKVRIETPFVGGLNRSLATLASLDRLSELVIKPIPTSTGNTTPVQGFNNLESLTLEGDCTPICGVLEMVAPSSLLRTLNFVVLPCIPAEARNLMHAVQTRFHSSLENIKVGLTLHLVSETLSPPEVFGPLLHAVRVRDVDLKLSIQPVPQAGIASWSDDDVRMLASAWQSLVSLRLTWDDAPRSPRPSLACLPQLARGCPALRRLHISELELRCAEGDAVTMAHGLETLALQRIWTAPRPGLGRDVAVFLDRLFPHLNAFMRVPIIGETRAWVEALDMIRLLQEVRSYERERMLIMSSRT